MTAGGKPPLIAQIGHDLSPVVANHGAEAQMREACFAQVDQVSLADLEQVSQFFFSQPLRGGFLWVHALALVSNQPGDA
jgi:hypothetical protein